MSDWVPSEENYRSGRVVRTFEQEGVELAGSQYLEETKQGFYVVYIPAYNMTKIGSGHPVGKRLQSHRTTWPDAKLVYLKLWDGGGNIKGGDSQDRRLSLEFERVIKNAINPSHEKGKEHFMKSPEQELQNGGPSQSKSIRSVIEEMQDTALNHAAKVHRVIQTRKLYMDRNNIGEGSMHNRELDQRIRDHQTRGRKAQREAERARKEAASVHALARSHTKRVTRSNPDTESPRDKRARGRM